MNSLFSKVSTFTKMSSFTKIVKFNKIAKINKRYDHHHCLPDILKTHLVVNLLGKTDLVDKASREIKSFADEKLLLTTNILYNREIMNSLLSGNNILQFIINRCYNMSCYDIIQLNKTITSTNSIWKPYNLYVTPNMTNKFVNCDFIKKYNQTDIIIYSLSEAQDIKRRHINILINK